MMKGEFVRRKIHWPHAAWLAAEQIAGASGCSVNDLLIRAAERMMDNAAYGQAIVRMYRGMFLPLAQWPADPVDCLLVAWMLTDVPDPRRRNVAIDDPDDSIDPDDWWRS